MNIVLDLKKTIKLITDSETKLRPRLASVATNLLKVTYQTGDVDLACGLAIRMFGGLTPSNQRVFALFVSHFMPLKATKTGGLEQYTPSAKRATAKATDALAFIDNDGDYWTWAKENTKTEAKAIDAKKRIENTFKKVIGDDAEHGQVTREQAIAYALEAVGVTAEELFTLAESANLEAVA